MIPASARKSPPDSSAIPNTPMSWWATRRASSSSSTRRRKSRGRNGKKRSPSCCRRRAQTPSEFGWTPRRVCPRFRCVMNKLLRGWRRAGTALVLGIATTSALAAWGAQPSGPAGSTAHKPSIIFILADDLGYGDLGCYGQTRIKTPNLDQLAADGIRFTNFYAGSKVCAPSRCTLMTGLHTGHALIRGNATLALRPQDLTVAEVLKQAGYHTGLIGKWGLGNPNTTGVPQKKGFNEFVGYLDQVHAHDYYTDYLWRYDPPSNTKPGYDGRIEFPENRGGQKGLYMDDLFTQAALNFVSINKPEPLNNFRPFFLYLAYTIPHANNEEGQRTGNGMQVPSAAPYSDEQIGRASCRE